MQCVCFNHMAPLLPSSFLAPLVPAAVGSVNARQELDITGEPTPRVSLATWLCSQSWVSQERKADSGASSGSQTCLFDADQLTDPWGWAASASWTQRASPSTAQGCSTLRSWPWATVLRKTAWLAQRCLGQALEL